MSDTLTSTIQWLTGVADTVTGIAEWKFITKTSDRNTDPGSSYPKLYISLRTPESNIGSHDLNIGRIYELHNFTFEILASPHSFPAEDVSLSGAYDTIMGYMSEFLFKLTSVEYKNRFQLNHGTNDIQVFKDRGATNDQCYSVRCDVPIRAFAGASEYTSSTSCASASLYYADSSLYTTVASGGSLIIPNATTTNSAGTQTSSTKPGQNTQQADRTLRSSDSGYTSPIVQGTDKTIPDITITHYNGSTSSVPYRTAISSTQLTRIYMRPPATGVPSSYFTRDDLWVAQNIYNAIPTVGYHVPADPSNRLLLLGNNVFGNTNRFTDTAGGQTYSNNYVIDHVTGLGWYRVGQTGISVVAPATMAWEANLQFGTSLSVAGFSDFYLPNIREIFTIIDANSPASSPFSLSTGSVAYNTSTTVPGTPTRYYRMRVFTSLVTIDDDLKVNASAAVRISLYCRKHF